MSVVELLEGTHSYTSMAEVAATELPTDAPEATIIPLTFFSGALISGAVSATVVAEC